MAMARPAAASARRLARLPLFGNGDAAAVTAAGGRDLGARVDGEVTERMQASSSFQARGPWSTA